MPTRQKAEIYYFPGSDPGGKFVLVIGGNAIHTSAEMREGVSTAEWLNELGYTLSLIHIFLIVFLEIKRTGVGDGAQVLFQLVFRHANAVIGDGQQTVLLKMCIRDRPRSWILSARRVWTA